MNNIHLPKPDGDYHRNIETTSPHPSVPCRGMQAYLCLMTFYIHVIIHSKSNVRSGKVPLKGVPFLVYLFEYATIDEFQDGAYIMQHACTCGGPFEISVEETQINIQGRSLEFKDLHILMCQKCGKAAIPAHSSKLARSAYDQAVSKGVAGGVFHRLEYRKKFDYCPEQNFAYDFYDYYNIPGLMFDDEHPTEGFLTPVYFDKKVLQQFLLDDDYQVSLGAETYGSFGKTDEWVVPFGININGKVVFWLGDLSYMDNDTLKRILPYNVESDHKLISSEFYAGQLCCIWAEPNREYQVYQLRNEFFNTIKRKFGIELDHLSAETKRVADQYSKPIIVNPKTFPDVVASLHKIVIEGIDTDALKKLYSVLKSPKKDDYKTYKSIKLYEGVLSYVIKKQDQVSEIITPLYLLNDLRLCYDHLLSSETERKFKNNVVSALALSSFDDVETLYNRLIEKLLVFYRYLIVAYSD